MSAVVTLPVAFARHADAESASQPVFAVTPVFGRPGLVCHPKDEMLSVVEVVAGRVLPVDCVPLRAFPRHSVGEASAKITAAFQQARADLRVEWCKASPEHAVPGWKITSQPEGHFLDFVLEHFGQDRVDQILKTRTREGAHEKLGLNLGPDYYSFMIRQMNPW